MNLKQLIKFGLEESSVPVIKNPILRAALEPRSTVPGPRNMYSQGQLVTPNVDGSRPGYDGVIVTDEIKAQFPEGDFNKHKYGFPKKHSSYEKVRSKTRTKERALYNQRAEVKEARRNIQNKAYQNPIKKEKILARNRKYITQPEVVPKRKKYMQKRYYEGGQREKDLFRLKGKIISENLGAYLQSPDNALIKDMIRAAKTDSNLKIIRGGPDNTVVAVQEGEKIYHAVGSNRKPVPGAPKNSTSIIKHPWFKKRSEIVKQQKEFKNTKVAGKDITYGEALDVLESKKAKTPIQNKNPAEYEHVKGVATDYKKGQIALRTANRKKQVIMSALKNGHITKAEAGRQLKKIGVRAFIDGKYIGAPKINPEKQFKDLKKYVDRKIRETGINPITPPEGITSPPKNIKGAISMELLDDMFKAGKITVGTAGGIMQAARKIGVEFEIAFLLGEFFNNVGKGQETDLAWANAKQSATMGFWKGGDRKYLEKLKELAKEEGIDPSTFEKVYEINKRDHLATTMGMTGQLSPLAQINTLEEQLKELKSTPKIFQDKKMITAKENLLNIKKGQLEKYKKETWDKESELIFDIRKNKAGYRNNIRPNLDKIADTPVYEDEYSDVFQNLGSIAVKYLDKEKKKAYDPKKPLVPEKIKRLLNIPAGQSEQLHSDMGPWGNLLSTNIFNMDVFTKQLPEMGKYAWDVINPTTPLPKLRTDFRTEAQKEQHRILEMAKKNKRELYLYNLARDNVPGVSLESFLDLATTKPGLGIRTGEASGGRAGYMGGGITNLKIKW